VGYIGKSKLSMRKIYFLLPGTGKSYFCGGLFSALNTLGFLKEIVHAELVTYHARQDDALFFDDILRIEKDSDSIFLTTWGPHIKYLVDRLKKHNIVYNAQSCGWNFSLPNDIPIIARSRYTLGYWANRNPNSPLYYLPNFIADEFYNKRIDRDIDILYSQKKLSPYLKDILLPALSSRCKVATWRNHVTLEELSHLYNRTKVYLYDSHAHWAKMKVTEGFGLPPQEAIACGCIVFSNLETGLSSHLDPLFNCYQIGVYSKEYDISRIMNVVNGQHGEFKVADIPEEYRKSALMKRFKIILEDINFFFDFREKNK